MLAFAEGFLVASVAPFAIVANVAGNAVAAALLG